ncbi:acyl-CoA dehydrogenase family protein [Sphingoaurantiacus capsulatus]|uniref:Acyl-CoA dehydrogenase family protein n=1 Tax=Sphingoaurantiacus capsulatus TaxID=1771310 RepID=A0ABV7XA38_9SPHN
MDFTFSEEQLMVAGVVRDLLADRCTAADLRRLMAADAPRDEERWTALRDMGLTTLLVPEAAGGLGLGEVDLVLIAEACGYTALPEPLVEQAGVVAPLLAAIDHPLAAEWLPKIASAEAVAALAHPASPFVADADGAAILLLIADGALHLVEAKNAALIRQPSIDPFRRLARVDWQPSPATQITDAATARPLIDQAFERGALFAAAQGLGLAQRSVDLAADYARERQQFGKPIGSYQAVKHLLATVQVAIEFAKPVVYAAAAQIAAGGLHARARVSHAKLAALGAAEQAARTGIQVHGAMGYSWEVDVHFFLKRSLALAGAWGDEAFHRKRVADRIFGAPLGPDQTFACGEAA